MPEIKSVIVTVAKPSGPGDYGQCEQGNYIQEGDVITMVNADGEPLRDENTGGRIEMRLLPSEDERAAAKKLTLRQYREANRDEMAGFYIRSP